MGGDHGPATEAVWNTFVDVAAGIPDFQHSGFKAVAVIGIAGSPLVRRAEEP